CHKGSFKLLLLVTIPACFGPPLSRKGFKGYLVEAVPANACLPIKAPPSSNRSQLGFIALIRRYDCPFGTKVLHAQQAGFQGAIIHNLYSDLLLLCPSSYWDSIFNHQIGVWVSVWTFLSEGNNKVYFYGRCLRMAQQNR
uniref:PA domain-containing protein n=1 Tax=Anolis carolinensis TaxID=28377 RepID=A0A803SUQ9_ANOCA